MAQETGEQMKIWPSHWGKQEQNTLIVPDKVNEVRIFSIKDTQLDTFGMVFEAPSSDDVKAGFVQGMRDPKAANDPLVLHAKHFELYEMGKVNKKTGIVTALEKPFKHFSLESLKN
ncbi:hypothetical protein [Microviridae sp.]|nr:hypothetical protein [Microviridae sp.]